jgi:hypothetical protein
MSFDLTRHGANKVAEPGDGHWWNILPIQQFVQIYTLSLRIYSILDRLSRFGSTNPAIGHRHARIPSTPLRQPESA